jgi:hypothetical protein
MQRREPAQASPTEPQPKRFGPPLWGKTIVSLLVSAHFFAIFTAVTAAGTSQFPPPPLLVLTKEYLTRPYLHFVFLTNPYRFFAPNPGPSNLLWFRVEYADGSVRWLEAPRRADWTLRMPYQRHLCTVLLFDQMANPISSDDPTTRKLSPEGKVVACSFARYVARKIGGAQSEGTPNPVAKVSIYSVMHSVLEPWQVQNGWDTNDLRLHTPFYIGTFGPDGVQLDAGTTAIEYRVVSDLAAHMLTRDIYPLFRKYPDRDRAELLTQVGAPPAIRALFYRFPELTRQDEMDRPDLKEIIEQLHGTQGIPADRLGSKKS